MYENFVYIDPKTLNDRCGIRVYPKYFVKRKKYDDLLAYILKTISNAILYSQQNDYQNFDIFVHLEDVKSSNLDFKFSKDFVIMIQQVFPDRLHKCYFYDSPAFFRIFFENLLIFIDRKTQRKIQFVPKQKPIAAMN